MSSDDVFVPPDPPADPSIIPQPEFLRGRHYRVEDYKAMFDGHQYLPNFEPIPLEKAASHAAASYSHLERGHAKLPDHPSGRQSFAGTLFILNATQGGGWDGTGTVIVNSGWSHAEQKYTVATGEFAICKHEKVEGAGANHMRGWHPGHCRKCGLDMSVDSGD